MKNPGHLMSALGHALWHAAEAIYLTGIDAASWSEIIWTINSSFVALVASVLILERRRDLLSLRRHRGFVVGGPRHLTARLAIALLSFVLLVSLSMIVVGVTAMNSFPPLAHLTPFGFAINTLFLLLSFGMGFLAWFCWNEYQRLRDFYDHPTIRRMVNNMPKGDDARQ